MNSIFENIESNVYYFFPRDEEKATNKKNKKTISKIVIHNFFLKNEIQIVEKLTTINDYKNKYYVFNEHKKMNITNYYALNN